MGCYQIVISHDNGRQSILLFLCWFTTLIISQKAGKCNHIPPPFVLSLLVRDVPDKLEVPYMKVA